MKAAVGKLANDLTNKVQKMIHTRSETCEAIDGCVGEQGGKSHPIAVGVNEVSRHLGQASALASIENAKYVLTFWPPPKETPVASAGKFPRRCVACLSSKSQEVAACLMAFAASSDT